LRVVRKKKAHFGGMETVWIAYGFYTYGGVAVVLALPHHG